MTSRNIKLASPYAEALLDISSESISTVISALNCISTTLKDSPELRKALSNPLLSATTKKNIVRSIFSENTSDTILKFLMVLCDRGRISYLEDITEKALEIAYKKASIQMAYVTSSIEVASSQEESLIAKLKSMTGAKQIKLKLTVDSSLLGGFVIQIGSKIIDNSVKGQLKQLASYLGASVL
jgi:F-type H+-transporting ATPase subunit delta